MHVQQLRRMPRRPRVERVRRPQLLRLPLRPCHGVDAVVAKLGEPRVRHSRPGPRRGAQLDRQPQLHEGVDDGAFAHLPVVVGHHLRARQRRHHVAHVDEVRQVQVLRVVHGRPERGVSPRCTRQHRGPPRVARQRDHRHDHLLQGDGKRVLYGRHQQVLLAEGSGLPVGQGRARVGVDVLRRGDLVDGLLLRLLPALELGLPHALVVQLPHPLRLQRLEFFVSARAQRLLLGVLLRAQVAEEEDRAGHDQQRHERRAARHGVFFL